jgi:hypothetical protein
MIQIVKEEINCGIFRHGSYKDTLENIPPHASREECDQLKNSDRIYGCGKPFSIIHQQDSFEISICDYI